MTLTAQRDDSETIRLLLKRISAAWQHGHAEEARACFHEDVVMVPPGFNVRAAGRDLCIKSYSDFMSAARVKQYEESEPSIDVWGDSAVATFAWKMAWEMKDQSYSEAGHDVWVFARQAGRWLAVWRTIFPNPNKS